MKMYHCCFKLLFLFFSSYHIYHIASAGCYSSFWSFSFQTGLKSPVFSFSRVSMTCMMAYINSQGKPVDKGRELWHTGGNNLKLNMGQSCFLGHTLITLSRNLSEALLLQTSLCCLMVQHPPISPKLLSLAFLNPNPISHSILLLKPSGKIVNYHYLILQSKLPFLCFNLSKPG